MSKIEVNAIEPQSGTTLTLGASGDTVTLAAGATSSGFGATYNGTVNWDTTKKTTGFTAVSGVGYFCDTTSAAFTVTLPSSPSAGSIVAIADYANTFATNNITVGRNGSNIAGTAVNGTLATNGISVTFVYVDATQGWIVTDSGNRSELPTAQYVAATGGTVLTCGNYKTHVFTGSGSFIVSNAGNAQGSNSVEYLVVAGGGGTTANGGGGGAGGYRQNYPSPVCAGLPVTATTYPITVGGGGSPSTNPPYINYDNTDGSPSIFSSITSAGGGRGGSFENPSNKAGFPGGSGGGATGSLPANNAGGTGNTPPVSPPQGNPGAPSNNQPNNWAAGGGAGAAGSSSLDGAGGIGSPIAPAFFGPTAPSYGTPGPAPGRYFAGGGGGANQGPISPSPGGPGGAGGGGKGATVDTTNNVAGTTNTGGGGGAGNGGGGAGKGGGSGIVVIRYKFQ